MLWEEGFQEYKTTYLSRRPYENLSHTICQFVIWSPPESVESGQPAPCPGRHCPASPQPVKMLSPSDNQQVIGIESDIRTISLLTLTAYESMIDF